jgi:TolB protein
MNSMKLLTSLFVASTFVMLSAQNPPPPAATAPPQGQQPSAIGVLISGRDDGAPPKMAVPEFIPLGKEPEVISAAKTIADVLWDDLAYEKEFYMLPRDILRTVPRPASVEEVSMDRWKELGAEGLVVGTVRKTADGIVVEARLLRVVNGAETLGKKYTGSARSLADGGRVYAHGIADEIHKQQRNLRGVARTKLAFSSDRDGARMKGPVAERDVSNIYMADYDGANQTRLTATRSLDIAPAWSPDGDSLAYTSYRSGYPDIILQSIRSLRPPTYPAKGSLENHNFLPAWSPDGTQLAFMSNRDGNPEIYVVNRDGSNLRRVTNHPSADVTPTWSPTGTQLAFTSDRSGRPQVYIVNLDGTGLDRISGESYCDRATWSPAPLNEIAYASQAGGGYEIRIFSFGTRESRAITDGIGSNESPAFAPNGRHLAFMSDRTGRPQIYTIARDGTDLRQITKQPGGNRYPNWSQ